MNTEGTPALKMLTEKTEAASHGEAAHDEVGRRSRCPVLRNGCRTRTMTLFQSAS